MFKKLMPFFLLMLERFNLQAENGSSTQFDFVADVHGVSIGGPNPANISLTIDSNSGATIAAF